MDVYIRSFQIWCILRSIKVKDTWKEWYVRYIFVYIVTWDKLFLKYCMFTSSNCKGTWGGWHYRCLCLAEKLFCFFNSIIRSVSSKISLEPKIKYFEYRFFSFLFLTVITLDFIFILWVVANNTMVLFIFCFVEWNLFHFSSYLFPSSRVNAFNKLVSVKFIKKYKVTKICFSYLHCCGESGAQKCCYLDRSLSKIMNIPFFIQTS